MAPAVGARRGRHWRRRGCQPDEAPIDPDDGVEDTDCRDEDLARCAWLEDFRRQGEEATLVLGAYTRARRPDPAAVWLRELPIHTSHHTHTHVIYHR